MYFIFQSVDAVCESHTSALLALLFHDCCSVAWLTCWGGMPECCMHERVFKEGGATWATAVDTCAQVFMRMVGLVGGTALCTCDARCLQWHSRLDDSATDVVSLWLGLVIVALWGVLIGLTVGISVGTFGIGAYGCMDCVICLLSLVRGMGMLAGAFILGTCCVVQNWSGVMVSLNWRGFVCTRACVASTIHCKSCAA
jgi:hypothetical protein